MSEIHFSQKLSTKSYSRQSFLLILNAAMDSHSYRFARQAAMNWLAMYPGDLGVQLIQARALFAEGNVGQALEVSEKICSHDPEFADAQLFLALISKNNKIKQEQAAACACVLGVEVPESISLPGWETALVEVDRQFSDGDIYKAEELLFPVLGLNLDSPLAAIYHVKIAMRSQDTASVGQLARLYHERWPECLQFSLIDADMQLRLGDATLGVDLLHSCAAKDATGQVPHHIWGNNHPYKTIWPEILEIDFAMSIPAEVTALLGWNILGAGSVALFSKSESDENIAVPSAAGENISVMEVSNENFNIVEPGEEALPVSSQPELDVSEDTAQSSSKLIELMAEENEDQKIELELSDTQPDEISPALEEIADVSDGENENAIDTKIVSQRMPKQFEDTLKPVSEAFEKLASKLNQPKIGRTDGRFPIYVILSTCTGLTKQYGAQTKLVIDKEMRALGDVIRKRSDWGAMVFYPDELDSVTSLGINVIDSIDPWRIKLSLIDLDKALEKKGAMIGALLIVGGNEVVPFHNLPNPTDDSDHVVLSDNPYATLDGNYFVPEWPIGRLPGEKGPDAGMLLEQLRALSRHHSRQREVKPWWSPMLFLMRWLQNFQTSKSGAKNRSFSNIGYSAAVWRRSSLAVFRPIGEGSQVLVSPPESSGGPSASNFTNSKLSYFNLHGMHDTPEWYGQRDIGEMEDGPDYPIALSTKDLVKNGHAPKTVFSEACYGGYIIDKSESESIALRFIQIGTLAVVGSTGIAYGSVSTPLIGADLLGYLFWRNLMNGYSIGESFMQAKIDFVREMNRRQGFLDGEDQKTLLTFVLYGDPLSTVNSYVNRAKSIPRMRNHMPVKTLTDQSDQTAEKPLITRESLLEIKQLVEGYLPGLDDAKIAICEESLSHNGKAKNQLSKSDGDSIPSQVVVTIHKEVVAADRVHQHYARATLNKEGKVVKLALSR